MVAFEDYFSARQRVDKAKVLLRLLHAHPPAYIAADDRGVVFGDARKALFNFLRMVLPVRAENVHRLVTKKGEMQVSDSVQRHKP